MTDASRAAIYPRYCFHLSPTVNTWCLLRIADIHALESHAGFEGENFYFHDNLPIKWVRVVGLVVAIDEYAGRRIFTLDDSTGACIEAMVTLPLPVKPRDPAEGQKSSTVEEGKAAGPVANQNPETYADIDVGAVVDVKGGLSTFREEKQIKVEKLVGLKSTSQELALWERRTKFRQDVLEKPWVLRNRDIRRCRKEAERSEEEAERRKKRLKAVTETSRHSTRPAPMPKKDDEKKPSAAVGISLRDLIEVGASGKYDALGL